MLDALYRVGENGLNRRNPMKKLNGYSPARKGVASLIGAAALMFTVACGQSDTGISTSVKTKLAADDTVKAYQVDVDTRDRIVTLTGEVETSAAKDRAVMIARETEGVRDVIDRITVNDTAATSGLLDRDDADASVEVKVDDDAPGTAVPNAAERAGSAIVGGAKRAGEATKDAVEKAGDATVKGAKKVGNAAKDAVTDDDRDSDKDGK
jgi:hypothetical protein